MPSRTAVLLGATGLVGGLTLRRLVGDPHWTRVVTLGRRPMPSAGASHAHHVVDFARLEAHAEALACDTLFCCLGTTMKQAGSQDAFRHVDHEIPVAAARLAHRQDARQMLAVSALGADAGSRVFYNRVKGETEDALRAVGFEALHLLRPSLLTGARDETRLGERVGELVLGAAKPLLIGPLRPLRPTPAAAVARCLAELARPMRPGVHVHGPDALRSRA